MAGLPWAARITLGVATFDSAVNFFSLRPTASGGAPPMLVVPDVNDIYAPLPKDLLTPLLPARERLAALLRSIPAMVAGTRGSDSAAVAAARGATLAMAATGGRVVLFMTSLPSVGLGSLKVGGGQAERACGS